MSDPQLPLWRRVQADAIRHRAAGHDLRTIAKRLGVGFGTVHRALHAAKCITVEAAQRHTPTAPEPGDVTTTTTTSAATVTDTKHPDGTRTVSIHGDLSDPTGARVTSLEALLERFGVDASEWIVTNARVKTWEGMRADKEADLEYKDGSITGYSRDHGGLHVQTLYSVSVTLAREPIAAARERLEALVSEYAARALDAAPPAPTMERTAYQPGPNGAYALVINAADLHYGAYAPAAQTGTAYDRPTAERLATSAVNSLISKATSMLGPPERIILALNGDLSHVDTKGRTTTKGTPQDTDGATIEIMLGAFRLARDLIERARAEAPVQVELTYGNHDEIFSALLRQHLSDLYEAHADVTVNNHQRRVSTAKYGNALLVFEHGDAFKPTGYGNTLLSEARDELAGVEHIEVITGHLHHHKEQDYGGFVHRQGMSISGTDVWHDQHRYRSKRGMSAYVLTPQHGITDTLTMPVSLLEEA